MREVHRAARTQTIKQTRTLLKFYSSFNRSQRSTCGHMQLISSGSPFRIEKFSKMDRNRLWASNFGYISSWCSFLNFRNKIKRIECDSRLLPRAKDNEKNEYFREYVIIIQSHWFTKRTSRISAHTKLQLNPNGQTKIDVTK